MLDNRIGQGVIVKDRILAFLEDTRRKIIAKYWAVRLWWWFRDHSAQDFEDALIDLGFKVAHASGDRNKYVRVYARGETAFTVTVETKS